MEGVVSVDSSPSWGCLTFLCRPMGAAGVAEPSGIQPFPWPPHSPPQHLITAFLVIVGPRHKTLSFTQGHL